MMIHYYILQRASEVGLAPQNFAKQKKSPSASPTSLLAFVFIMLVSGCTPRFYLSESEVGAYRANMRTAASANDLWDNLANQTVELRFQSSPGSAPRIQSSNLLEIFRSIPEFYFLEQTFRQIRLDRLTTQFEQDLSDWAGDRLLLLVSQGGAEVKLQGIDLVAIRFLAAPAFTYQSNIQTISFNTQVRLQITGAIHITDPRNDLEKFVTSLAGHDSPEGTHQLRIIVDNYQLQGNVRLATGFADEVRLSLTPTPGTVTVESANQNPIPNLLRDTIAPIVTSRLSSPVHETIYLAFDHFALRDFKLLPAPANELTATYHSRPAVADENLDVVARAEDGRLYHARKLRGEWQPVEMIPLTDQGIVVVRGASPSLVEFGSDPALVSPTYDQLELAAISTNGELYYAGYRNGEWGNFYGSAGQPGLSGRPTTTSSGRISLDRPFSFAQAKPALVATAPGQLEIFALGTDGYIHHVRRLDGEWREQTFISNTVPPATPPLRDPTAVQVGNKIILVYVDAQNRLFTIGYDLETEVWAEAMEIPTQGVLFAPAAVASGDGFVDLVYVGSDQAAYHRNIEVVRSNFPSGVRTGMIYNLQTRIGGTLTASPVLTCSGFRQLELMGRGTDNRIYHNHFVGPASPANYHYDRQINRGWQSWEEASEMLFGSIQLRRFNGEMALASTRTGQVHAIARARGDSPQSLYHNNYNSMRFGIAPWKAVHWRGFERIATQQFVGAPALALSGRELEIVIVGNQNIPFHFNLSDQGMSPISFVQNLPTNLSSDPTILSSGSGLVDMLFIGQNGQPQHLRRVNNRIVEYETIPPISGNVSSIAATSFGEGQIELMAVMQNRSVHHWRYLHGLWQPPAQIGSAMSSKPVIVNMGAGELVLIAVGEDRKLHYWKFDHGQWQTPQQIFSVSAVSADKFGSSAVSSWGDGTLDIVFVDENNGRMVHRRILPNEDFSSPQFFTPDSPSRSSVLPGQALETPILTAFGPQRLNVVAKGADGRIYSSWTVPPVKAEATPSSTGLTLEPKPSSTRPSLTRQNTTMRAAQLSTQNSLNTTNQSGIDPTTRLDAELSDKTVQQKGPAPIVQWRSFEPISWQGLAVGGVAKQGEHELMAVAADQAGRVYVNRYFGWRWKGFTPVISQTDQVQHQSAFKPGIAAH